MDLLLLFFQQRPGVSKQDLKLGIIMGITLPLSLLVFWYITLPALSYCAVSLLGAKTVKSLLYVKEGENSIVYLSDNNKFHLHVD